MATVFPNAIRGVSVSGPVGNTTGNPGPWGNVAPDGSYAYNDPFQAQIDMLQQRMSAPAPAPYTPDQIAQRKADNANQYALGVLGTLSGNQALGDVGGQVLKQALANRQPRYTDHGTYDPISGEFNYSPDYLQERDAGMLQQAMGRQAQGYMQYQEAQSRNQQRAEAAQQHMEMMMALKSMGGSNAGGNFHPWGYMPDGSQVVTNSKDGMQYSVKAGPDGRPQYTMLSGNSGATPASTWEKNVADIGEQVATAGRIDSMLQVMHDNPNAFGARGSMVSALPAAVQGVGASTLGLSQQDLAARASIMRQASIELNHLYGAAVSAHEESRANTFLPNMNDPPEIMQAKLQAARDWAYEYAGKHGQGPYAAALSRGAGSNNPVPVPGQSGPGPAPAPPGAPGGNASDPLGLRR